MRRLYVREFAKLRRISSLKCFIGLGNPGKNYEKTRHNIGFMALGWFAELANINAFQVKGKSLLAEGQYQGQKVILLKPTTYMNLSGEAVRAAIDYFKLPLDDIVVLYDDLDLPFGHLRLRNQGSSGGHNGMKSIIQHLGTEKFSRIRIGISRPMPGSSIADYVLSNFTIQESKQLSNIFEKTSEVMTHCLSHKFEETMGIFNQS